MKKNIDENIVLDEQQKEDEQSKKKMPKDKVKRIVLAVLFLILAVVFVVLGAFCATGYVDKFSTSANVAYADTIVDVSSVKDYSFSGRIYLGYDDISSTPAFNSVVVTPSFDKFFSSYPTVTCERLSIIDFYRVSDDKKVADIIYTRSSELVGNLSLRIFADDKLSSYTTVKMFDFYATADDDGALTKLGFRTFTNSYCFGYGADNRVYASCVSGWSDNLNGVRPILSSFMTDFASCLLFYNDVIDDYAVLSADFNRVNQLYDDLYSNYEDSVFSYVPIQFTPNGGYDVLSRSLFKFDSEEFSLCEFKTSVAPDKLIDVSYTSFSDVFTICSLSDFNFDSFYSKYYSDKFNQNYYYVDSDGLFHYLVIAENGTYAECFHLISDVVCPSYCDDFYQCGYGVGYTKALNDTDTVVNGVIDVIESPVDLLKAVFNFEIFGINISSVIFFVISVVIVAFVIKKVV